MCEDKIIKVEDDIEAIR